MMTYKTAAPRIGKVAPGRKRGLIERAMTTPKPPVVRPVQPQRPKY